MKRVSKMLTNGKNRAAFTMIEMIMVIVILGVVAMIGTDIIARMYQGYIKSQIVNELQQKTELALEQIAKRLKYRIKETAIAKNVDNPNIFKPLSENNSSALYNMIEWIGYDNEGFLGTWNGANNRFEPNWSGFIDVRATGANETNTTQASTNGSRLSQESSLLGLSYNRVSLSNLALDAPAILFKKHANLASPRTFGLDPTSTDHNDTFAVRRNGDNILLFQDGGAAKTIVEQYYFVWTAYAIGPRRNSNSNNDNFDLMLYYNYQPWLVKGGALEAFDDPGTQSQLIVDNVSTFRFTQTGNTVQIKLCVQDGNRTGTPIGFCKEKAVF